MIWEYALFSEKHIIIEETNEHVDYDSSSPYGNAYIMKPSGESRLDLVSFLLVAPSEREMILDALFSNVFEFNGCSRSIHWFLDHLPKSCLLRISTLHLANRALLEGLTGNSDRDIESLAAFIEWSMHVHFLGLHVPHGNPNVQFYDELWFKLVARTFFKRMIAGVDLRWAIDPICREPEELMLHEYLEKFDVLDGGRLNKQAVIPWEIDNDILYPPINQVKWSLFNQYYSLKPFTHTGREFRGHYRNVRDGPWANVMPPDDFALLFRHQNLKHIEKVVARMEEQLDSGGYDELEEKAAIYPTVVPPLKERVRRAQRMLKDMKAQVGWAMDQKKKLCEGICSHVHRNVRVQHYHPMTDTRGAFRMVEVRAPQNPGPGWFQ